MRYLFRGRLCGYICASCPEAVSDAKIRLYRLRAGQQETALATASPKETFRVLDGKAVDEKGGSLIAEAETDADGNFSFELDERQKYDGGPFELDVYLESVPGLGQEGAPARKPVQFTITTLQPSGVSARTCSSGDGNTASLTVSGAGSAGCSGRGPSAGRSRSAIPVPRSAE